MKHRLIAIALFLACVSQANAGGAGPMWTFPVWRLCIAQEPRYGETPVGQWVLQGRLKLASPKFAQCARAKQWIPAHVCKELMSLESEQDMSRSNLERLGNKYVTELKILSVAAPYVMEASEAEVTGRELPACP